MKGFQRPTVFFIENLIKTISARSVQEPINTCITSNLQIITSNISPIEVFTNLL